MQFLSSRTFPGQLCCFSIIRASAESRFCVPPCAFSSAKKCSASSSTSSPCLHVERHFRHFVEQQRPSLGAFEHPGVRADRTGEASPLVTEQFSLDEPGRYGAAIDGNEGAVAARAALVNRLSRQLLSGTAFTGQEHVGLGGSDPFDEPKHFLHSPGCAQQGTYR